MKARPEFLDPEDDPEADERASFLARWAGRKVPPTLNAQCRRRLVQ